MIVLKWLVALALVVAFSDSASRAHFAGVSWLLIDEIGCRPLSRAPFRGM
jgi:hypothetical protein